MSLVEIPIKLKMVSHLSQSQMVTYLPQTCQLADGFTSSQTSLSFEFDLARYQGKTQAFALIKSKNIGHDNAPG